MSKVHRVIVTISADEQLSDLFDEAEVEEELDYWANRTAEMLGTITRAIATEKVHNSDRHIDWVLSDVVSFETEWEATND